MYIVRIIKLSCMKLKEIAFDLRGMQALKLSNVMFLTQLLKKVENGAAGAH